jgi:hypothetical protein
VWLVVSARCSRCGGLLVVASCEVRLRVELSSIAVAISVVEIQKAVEGCVSLVLTGHPRFGWSLTTSSNPTRRWRGVVVCVFRPTALMSMEMISAIAGLSSGDSIRCE